MPLTNRPVRFSEEWQRSQVFTTTPGVGGWNIADTSSAGSPVARIERQSGVMCAVLRLDNTNEAQNLCLYMNDLLPWLLKGMTKFRCLLQMTGLNSVTKVTAGIASARNDDPDAIGVHATLRFVGPTSTTALYVRTDDNVNDSGNVAAGVNVKTTWMDFLIDLSRKDRLVMTLDGVLLAELTQFRLDGVGATQGVQPFFQVQKASGTGVPELRVAPVDADYVIQI